MSDVATPPSEPVPLLERSLNSGIINVLGEDLYLKIRDSKILLVGSGGIGCELIKNLALMGFRHVEVIDLDTIDISNLNRQFLFRSQHVGSPKCTVACAAATSMSCSVSPSSSSAIGVDYKAHHGNVKENDRFGMNFFKRFDAVLNALDNVDARRHVNRLCLAADLPLIEAGTTGYLGQVTVINPQQTECYECQPKPTQKVYPICTIRSTPDKPVHCIVWAKEVWKLMFGDETSSMIFEDESGDEKSVFMSAVVAMRLIKDKSLDAVPSEAEITKYCEGVIESLYKDEVQKQIDMDRYATSKIKPKPLDVAALFKSFNASLPPPPSSTPKGFKSQWSLDENYAEFHSCVTEMLTSSARRATLYTSAVAFDKDDNLSMRFVCCASNLRSSIFEIQRTSLYECKGIAGNIIPAIATTNAIVAGLQVMELIKIIKHGKESIMEKCKFTYCLRDKTRKGLYLQPTTLQPPNPKCFVCRNAPITISVDCNVWNLQDLIDKVLKRRLSFCSPIIQIGYNQIYEEGEDEYDQNLEKTLAGLPCGGIVDGVQVTVEDYEQDLEVLINFVHRDDWDEEEEPDGFTIGGDRPVPKVLVKESEVEEKKPQDGGKGEGKKRKADDDVVVESKKVAKGGGEEGVQGGNGGADDEIEIL